jgi:uncharacterized SAM-binding protein YcdF (DUF218 family)
VTETDGARRGLALAALALLVLTTTAALVPQLDPIGDVDAVVVLGGGTGERLELGTEVAAGRGVPLVLAGDTVSEGRDRGLDCGTTADLDPTPVPVLCAIATPATTAGEARATAVLAREEGWRRVAVVTSTFHVDRARTLFAQCLGAPRVDVTGAPAPTHLGAEAWRRARELVARVAAVTVRPAC